MSWFRRSEPGITDPERPEDRGRRSEGLWEKCGGCTEFLYRDDLDEALGVCVHCGHHFPRTPDQWIANLLDPGSFEERDGELRALDPLTFKDRKRYDERLKVLEKKRGLTEAFVSGEGLLGGRKICLGVFDFRFLGGSMGSVVGEKVCRLFDRAVELRCPAIILSASGGARMQEGVLSLMQMAKTSASLARLRAIPLPYLSILLHPTTGGVAASFAMQGDVIISEPGALVGFAGPRVIQQTIGQTLPEGFQRSEFLLEHGMIDAIVPRAELRTFVQRVLGHLQDP